VPGLNRNSKQTLERMDLVEAALAKLHRHKVIEKQFSALWNISRTQVRKYIALVYEEWKQRADAGDTGKERHRLRAALQDLYVTAVNSGDLNAAVNAADRLCRLDGLFSPQQLVIGATVTANIRSIQAGMTTAEKRKEIEKLLEERKRLLDARPAEKIANSSNGSNGSNGVH